MSLAEARNHLTQRQASLLQGLTGRGAGPAGMDRLAAAAAAMMTKRLRAVARAWPSLVSSLGDEFEPRFREFARRTPLPETGGPLADGRTFAGEIPNLTDEARLELLSVNLHREQRGPTLKAVWLRESGRVVIGMRLPWLGEWWVSIPWRTVFRRF